MRATKRVFFIAMMTTIALLIGVSFKYAGPDSTPSADEARVRAKEALDRGDTAEVLHWLRFAAERGNAIAQSSLGAAYCNSMLGFAKNISEALKWYRMAAEQGYAIAQNELGVCIVDNIKGIGHLQEYFEAAKWFQLAAKQGNADTRANLEDLLRTAGSGARIGCFIAGYPNCQDKKE